MNLFYFFRVNIFMFFLIVVITTSCIKDNSNTEKLPLKETDQMNLSYEELYSQSMDYIFDYLIRSKDTSRSNSCNKIITDDVCVVLTDFYKKNGYGDPAIYSRNYNTGDNAKNIKNEQRSQIYQDYWNQLSSLGRLIKADDLKRAIERIERDVISDNILPDNEREILLNVIYAGKVAIKYWKEDKNFHKWVYEFDGYKNYNLTRLEKYSKNEKSQSHFSWNELWNATLDGASTYAEQLGQAGAVAGGTLGGLASGGVGILPGASAGGLVGTIGGALFGAGYGAIANMVEQTNR